MDTIGGYTLYDDVDGTLFAGIFFILQTVMRICEEGVSLGHATFLTLVVTMRHEKEMNIRALV
jgi:hypothetical protein